MAKIQASIAINDPDVAAQLEDAISVIYREVIYPRALRYGSRPCVHFHNPFHELSRKLQLKCGQRGDSLSSF